MVTLFSIFKYTTKALINDISHGGGGVKTVKKIENMGYFHARELLNLAFLSSLTRKYMLWEGFYHDFSTKRRRLYEPSPPGSHQGAGSGCPWTDATKCCPRPWSPRKASPPPPGGTQLFFCRYVPRGFPKVGSRERIFFEKLGVLGTKIWEIWLLKAEILAKN